MIRHRYRTWSDTATRAITSPPLTHTQTHTYVHLITHTHTSRTLKSQLAELEKQLRTSESELRCMGLKIEENKLMILEIGREEQETGKCETIQCEIEAYAGQTKDGHKHGVGTFVAANGVTYTGEWVDGKKHGKGTYVSARGKEYNCNWAHDKPIDGDAAANKSKCKTIQGEIEANKKKISSTEKEIEKEEQPPAALFQPLPEDENKAMSILFFVHMPPLFQVLSRMSFMAQQMLVPSEDTIGENKPKTIWMSYYQNHHKGKVHPVSTKVVLGSHGEVPQAKDVGPSNVTLYTSSRDGVWHPDTLTPAMWWEGGGFVLDARGGRKWKEAVAGWTEHATNEGRKFYQHVASATSQVEILKR
jgi:hypothetical protein